MALSALDGEKVIDIFSADGNKIDPLGEYTVTTNNASDYSDDYFIQDFNWSTFHHDIRSTGFSPSSAPNIANPLWIKELGSGGAIWSSPAISTTLWVT